MKVFINMLQGFFMAIADSVPGVSGGTIAFIMGFYDKFILSLNNLISGSRSERKEAGLFLVKLMCGWVIGLGLSVLTLSSVFDSHIYELCSLFLGLTACSIPLLVREEAGVLMGKYRNLIFTLAGVVTVVLISYLNPASGSAFSVDVLNLSLGKAIYVFVVAAIAISAMVLPGISGSTLLLIFGLYIPIMSAVKELLTFNFEGFPVLCIFGLGILTGVITIVKAVKIGLEKFRSPIIYFIMGLMLGSMYAIVMGPATLEKHLEALSLSTFSPMWFLMGAVILAVLQLLKRAEERHNRG
ncbi:MAG: DUF368 domain-containing protein [Clostridia bacterium]